MCMESRMGANESVWIITKPINKSSGVSLRLSVVSLSLCGEDYACFGLWEFGMICFSFECANLCVANVMFLGPEVVVSTFYSVTAVWFWGSSVRF
ncbi:hypothetical protein VNO80_09321 [Phaseolus coccineus]|uniref:Uncharacterized protein n=1 Tax=Phaseolus coccineus TaxID=3886 RepID=A0AAN9NB94_PHACN